MLDKYINILIKNKKLIKIAKNPKLGVPIAQLCFSAQTVSNERKMNEDVHRLIRYSDLTEKFPKRWYETNQGLFILSKFDKDLPREYYFLGEFVPIINIKIPEEILDNGSISGLAGATNPWMFYQEYNDKLISIDLEGKSISYTKLSVGYPTNNFQQKLIERKDGKENQIR